MQRRGKGGGLAATTPSPADGGSRWDPAPQVGQSSRALHLGRLAFPQKPSRNSSYCALFPEGLTGSLQDSASYLVAGWLAGCYADLSLPVYAGTCT